MSAAIERNREAARRFFEEIWSTDDASSADELLSPDLAFVLSFMRTDGIEAFKDLVRRNRAAFKGLTYRPNDIVADEQRAAVHWTMSAQHVGLWNNIAGTGKNVSIEGISFFYFEDGRIRTVKVQNDVQGLIRQLNAA